LTALFQLVESTRKYVEKNKLKEISYRKMTEKIPGYEHGEIPISSDKVEIYTENSVTTSIPHLSKSCCPVCKGDIVFDCPCPKQDQICERDHVWWYDSEKLIIEDPHEE
jgi:hypothetical protein